MFDLPCVIEPDEEQYVVDAVSANPPVIQENDYPDIGEICQKDILAQKKRKRLHCRENHLETKKPGPYSHIATRPQLFKLLLDIKSIPWGKVPNNIRDLLQWDDDCKLVETTEPDYCIENNQLRIRSLRLLV